MCRKERRMNERVEYSQLDCYKRATDEQKRKLNQTIKLSDITGKGHPYDLRK